MQHVNAALARLGNLCKSRHYDQALVIAISIAEQGIRIRRDIIYCLLKGCGNCKDPKCAKKLHWLMVKNKLDRVPVLADHLIRLFVSCSCLEEAHYVFNRVLKPSVYTWNAILSAHSNLGNIELVLELFQKMKGSGMKPDRVTMLCMLRVCGNSECLEQGRLVHEEILKSHLEFDLILGSALVDMYSKCGELEDARKIFYDLPHQDIVAWGALIAGHAQHEDGFITLQLFVRMQNEGVASNEIIYSSIIRACAKKEAAIEGQIIHSQVVEEGLDRDIVIVGSLIDMYSRSRTIEDAQRLFQNAIFRDAILWTTMVTGYALCGLDQLSLNTFKEMLQEGIMPTKPTLLCIMKGISNLCSPSECRILHDLMIKIKLDQDLMLCNALIDTYAKCTALAEAERVFKCMPKRDIVSWTSLIEGYEEQGDCEVVIRLFLSMQESGISPDRVVLLSVLKACAGSGNIAQGRSIHNQLKSWGLAYDQLVCNALIDMYSKCRSLEEAHTVFSELESPNEVSWGAIISGYVNDGNGQAALQLVMSMLKKGQELGKPVLVSSIKACSFLLALPEGRLLHSHAIQHGLVSDTDIECSALNMYSRCGCIKDAMRVFDRLPSHDIVAWTSIILSCANHQKSTAVELFMKLQEEGIGFNTPILLCIVEACGGIKNIIQGRIMHHRILKYGMESDASIANLLISMYAKCQCLQEARSIFDMCTCRDEMTWGAIIAGYIHNAEDSLPCDLFKQCECTFFGREMVVCILKACSSTYSFVMGKITHFLAVHIGLETDLVIGSVLINMYTKCMSTHDALSVFNCLPAHDLVTYSTLIAGLVNFGQYFLALELHAKVPFEAHADKHVQQNMLTVCGILNLIRQGRHIHNEIIKNELDSDAGIRTALVDMYMNCSSLEEAQKVFISACEPDITMWGTVVAGYTHHGDCKKALQCVEHMNQHRISPTIRMFSTILSACSHAGAVEEGRHCFKLMTEECNILPRVEHLNCLIDLFGRAGHLDIASDLVTAMPTLPDTVGWKAFLISCQIYGQHELGHEFFDETVMEIYDTDVYSVSEDLCMEAFEGSKMQKSTMNNSEHAGSLLFNKKITSANNFTSFGHKLEYNKINIFSSLTLQ